MRTKAVIAIILGLVFQLAQALPVVGGGMLSPALVSHCECCDGPSSCHCADQDNPEQKPAPSPLDTTNTLKIPAMKSAETRVVVNSFRKNGPSASVVDSPPAGALAGYIGVRFSVAFCSFVI
jgi:hypothetical protein